MNTRWALSAIDYCIDNGAQYIIHTGDFGYMFTNEYVGALAEKLADRRGMIWFVDGNHENFEKLYRWPIREHGRRQISKYIHHLPRGYRWEWDGKIWMAMGGAYSIDRKHRVLGQSVWNEETITLQQVFDAAQPGPADVMICHDAPAGVTIPGIPPPETWDPIDLLRSMEHQRLLRQLVDVIQPKILYHGHFHSLHHSILQTDDYRTSVIGLDCDDSSLEDNILFVDTEEIW